MLEKIITTILGVYILAILIVLGMNILTDLNGVIAGGQDTLLQAATDAAQHYENVQATSFAPTATASPNFFAPCNDELEIYLFDDDRSYWDQYTERMQAAACDLDYYWSQVVISFLHSYEMPAYILQEDADTPSIVPEGFSIGYQNIACYRQPASDSNPAYYCPTSTGIVFRENLHYSVYRSWERQNNGNVVVVWTMAHEWAHHVQHTMIDVHDSSELQAECLVGVYFQYAIANPDNTRLDMTIDDWNTIQRNVPILGNQEQPLTDSGGWANISMVDRGIALRQGYDEGILSCINGLDEFLLME